MGSMDFGDWKWSANPLWLWLGIDDGIGVGLRRSRSRAWRFCVSSPRWSSCSAAATWNAPAIGVRTKPLKAGAIGLLAQLLFLPVLVITIVVLVITIIGIPLLLLIPFVILGLAIVGLVGFTGVGVSRWARCYRSRFGWPTDNPYTTTIVGIVLVLSPLLLARLVRPWRVRDGAVHVLAWG